MAKYDETERFVDEFSKYCINQERRIRSLEEKGKTVQIEDMQKEIHMMWDQMGAVQQLRAQVEMVQKQIDRLKEQMDQIIRYSEEGKLSESAENVSKNIQEDEEMIDEDATLLLMENEALQTSEYYCPICRGKVEKGMRYCIHCGTKL